ncbi:hypothetical protein AKJ09_10779 [Labilithrix luteola]|uniref:Tryptophan synthase alpha chain n=1 Tax=Labilithrix luteola TaxID=1391654 RepID=A0A0K1QEC2_9BACT|nr:hypothetical protein AKJ09_10779 [Labilithrix luteola]
MAVRDACRATVVAAYGLVVVGVAFAAGAACTPDDLGGTCHFQGETTNACGECIASSCRMVVDTCCGDESCRTSLSSLDTCASGGGCSSLVDASASMAKLLAVCVKSSCSNVCADEGSPLVDGGAPVTCVRNDETKTCACESGESTDASSAVSCVVRAGSAGVCCAEKGWPAKGTSCGCAETACVDYGDDTNCVCGLLTNIFASGDRVRVQSACSSVYGHCCQKDDGSCTCGLSTCGDAEEVHICWASDVRGTCSSGATEVRSCH